MKKQKDLIDDVNWDILVILDACRYDYFKKNRQILSNVTKCLEVDSNAYETEQWYRRNWNGEYSNTCLISANPVSTWSSSGNAYKRFDDFFPIFMPDENVNDLGVVEPSVLFDLAFNEVKENDWNRYVVHEIAPHIPYIDTEGREFFEQEGLEGMGAEMSRDIEEYARSNGWSEIERYYEESLKIALKNLDDFLVKLKNNCDDITKVIVTADHGDALGEKSKHGHGHYDLDFLRIVPWCEVDL